MKELKTYGSWTSPISSSLVANSPIGISDITIDQNEIYWSEFHPSESGRSLIVKYDKKKNKTECILDKPFSARSKVHEYGGGSFTVHNKTLYFSNESDQHFYSLSNNGKILDLTKDDQKRYANPIYDTQRNVLYAVEETHHSDKKITNSLVQIDVNNSRVKTIHEGWDFYGMLAIHPKNTHLAFITWNHPNMPWDETTLWKSSLKDDGSLSNIKKVAGGLNESIIQPEWNSKGQLFFISDKTGYWNIYYLKDKNIFPCHKLSADFGRPFWVFGNSNYDFLSEEKIACIYTMKGLDQLEIIDLKQKKIDKISLPFTSLSYLKACENTLFFIASSPTQAKCLISYDFKNMKTLCKSSKVSIESSYISIPEAIEFPTEDNKTSHGFFYPPKNRDQFGEGKPPLIIKSHGGPSSQASPSLNLEVQFWTSRGFAYFDVNYGGSTGYGRKYRERLKGQWGIVDVNDCANGAQFLIEKGKVDREKIAIKGSSAGGYTALAGIAFKDIFKAGVSYYGVSDLTALAASTHKFELHYLDGLIGPYPKSKKRYIRYSPKNNVDKITCPVLLFQGSMDKVVPPSQANAMYEALNTNNIPVALIQFEGEKHGFKKPENIQKAFEFELFFYSKVFNFFLENTSYKLKIQNLK